MHPGNVEELGSNPQAQQSVVLVLEDDVLERMWVSRCLRADGFTVVEAATIEEAQLALHSAPEIDVVFSDIVMPNNSNVIDLIAWMERETPDVPVVLTSGQSRTVEVLTLTSCSNVMDFLPKPFACEQLQRILREQLAAKG